MTVSRTQPANAGAMSLTYPATWAAANEDGALFAAADLRRGGAAPARISVREVPKAQLAPAINTGGEQTLTDAATAWSLQRGRNLTAYRVIGITPTTVNGREAVDVEYAYVSSGQGLAGMGGGGLPVLVRAADTVVASGDSYAILTFAADSAEWDRLNTGQFPRFRSVHDSILSSWRVP
jgi:hypothetical protein